MYQQVGPEKKINIIGKFIVIDPLIHSNSKKKNE